MQWTTEVGKKPETAQLFVISSSISFPIVIYLSFFSLLLGSPFLMIIIIIIVQLLFADSFLFFSIHKHKKRIPSLLLCYDSLRSSDENHLSCRILFFGSVFRLKSVTHDAVQYFMRIADNVSFAPLFILSFSIDHLILSDIFFCAFNIFA